MDIIDKVAVVSGGGSGIGRATVLALVERGASVVVADVDEAAGQRTVDLVAGRKGTAVFARCDVTEIDDLSRTFAFAIERFGQLDVAFNNAGVGGEDLFADDPGDWKRVIDIDLTAVIDATRIAVREMERTGRGGVVINTASLIGLGPMADAPVYAAAKAGVVNFSRSLAYLKEESCIRVNAICPELVDTPMAHGLGEERLEDLRAADEILPPEEIAAGVVELIEDDSRAGAVMRITIRDGRGYVPT
ncbi:SDR family NAD(P)-dependent oxidoreductase [Natrinema soli]|uniref:SDR family NAD(P)-dependent oxidoreductase n=1 Tax=Natrinema soli TaxID=1930624 RepID=A0ABD5SUK1_9EURY|nr:SDR family NAD(P)-dependent oxidoreductase [Natrinema soli]